MKLTIKSMLNGVIVSTVSASFTDVNDYIQYLTKFDIEIDEMDAAMDMHNAEVELTIPCTSVSNSLGQEVDASDESLVEQIELNFNESALFERSNIDTQVDLYAKKH